MKKINPVIILIISLIAIPLLGSITLGPYFSITDSGNAREFLILMFIIGIYSLSVQKVNIPQNVRNPYIYALFAFIPVSIYLAPPIRLMYGYQDIGGLWMWRAFAWAFAYLMLYHSILAIPITECQKKNIGKAIGWVAIISSGYAYVQACGIDQFMFTGPDQWIGNPAAKNITAAIGNPTVLGVWLCICLPFIMTYFKKRWFFFVAGAILLTKSAFALAGLVFIPLFVGCLRFGDTRLLKVGCFLALILALNVGLFWGKIRPYLPSDNSRYSQWSTTFTDWREPAIKLAIRPEMTVAQKTEIGILNTKNYTFTGRGPDSFRFFYGIKHNVPWENPHNDYLSFLYNLGLIGLALALLAFGFVIIRGFPSYTDYWHVALYASFIYVLLAAIGTPIIHTEPLRYFAAVVFCLLSRKIK